MADRNPSKQRRQAQNRAAREARKARAAAANTPVEQRRVEEEPEEKRPRRRRARRDDAEVKARAREVIETSADEIDDADFDLDEEIDELTTEPAQPAKSRRSASPVFSARHRAEVAAATADKAPARTHAGVGAAVGVAVAAPDTTARASKTVSGASRSGSGTTTRPASDSSASKTASNRSASSSRSARSAQPRSAQAAKRPTRQPPAKPLPPWLDRFGGNEPGGRWVMLSFLTILLASIVLNFVHIVPEMVTNSKGDRVPTGTKFTIWHFGIGPGLYFLLPPILILGLFILTARPSNRRRSWNMALLCLVFITFVTSSIAIYLIPIACLAWGCWQARKAALDEVGGDPRVLREVERERRMAEREALRERRQARAKR